MNQFRKTLIIIFSVVIAAAIISTVIFFINFNSILSNPIVRVISASKNTFTAHSARIDAALENTPENEKISLIGQYQIEPDNKTLKAEFNISSKPIKDSSESETKINIKSNLTENGGKILYTKDGKTETVNISKEESEQFFKLFSETKDLSIKNVNRDWSDFVNGLGLQDYINADKVEDSLISVYNALSTEESKTKMLGLSTQNTENGDIISFELNPYLTADCVLENIKPIFKRSDDYEYYHKLINENQTTLDNVVFKFDVTISPDGFLREVSADNFGIKLNIKISDIKDNSTGTYLQ